MRKPYLAWTVDGARTIVLINNNRVLDILHDGVLERYVLHESAVRFPPCLDPEPVLRPREDDRLHRDVLHAGSQRRPPQASNATT